MIHVAVRAVHGTLLFRTWAEARALWDRLVARVRFKTLTLMPNHLHTELVREEDRSALSDVMSAYARWRNHARGERGQIWRYGDNGTPVVGEQHERRTMRYIYLNPCRRGLVDDPLAWPFSTYRDMVGLAIAAACRVASDPDRLHAWVSADPSVAVGGTLLPVARRAGPRESPTLAEVWAAVSALTRTPNTQLSVRGPARDLLLRASRVLTSATDEEVAAAVGVHPATVRRRAAERNAQIDIVERVVGDPRFALLRDGDLRTDPRWRSYRGLL